MKKIIQKPVSLAAEYNLSFTDAKEDYTLAELNLVPKVTFDYEITYPVISGHALTYALTAAGATEAAAKAHVLTGLGAVDANGLDISEDIEVALGSVETPWADETAGTYPGAISVEDVDGDEAEVAFTFALKAAPTFSGISSGATFQAGTVGDALTLEQVTTIVLTGATAEDADENDITASLVVDIPGFDGSVADTYSGTVSVTDQWGGTNSVNINVVIASE